MYISTKHAKTKERMWKICVNQNLKKKTPHSCLIIILNSLYVDIIFNFNVLHSSVLATENDTPPSSSRNSSSSM